MGGGKHPFLILHLHSPSEVLELISQNLQKNPSATSSYSQPQGKARWTGQLPWGVYFSNHCFRSPVATSRASKADSGCCRHHLGLTSLTFFLCISKVETEPRTLWALVEVGGKMHTELYTWLPFRLPDVLPRPHFPRGQSEQSCGALEKEDKDECNGEGEGYTPALGI